jgi:hypothetical protein
MIESGHKLPSVAFFIRFAHLFGINEEWAKRQWLRDYLSFMEVKIKEKIGVED